MAAAALMAPVLAAPIADSSLSKRTGDIIQGGYIITLKSDSHDIDSHVSWVNSVHKRNVAKRGLSKRQYSGIERQWASANHYNGYAGLFDDATIEEIRKNPEVSLHSQAFTSIPLLNTHQVESVEEDRYWFIDDELVEEDLSKRAITTQEGSTYGLAAISHRQPGATNYIHDDTAGEGTFAYVIDSGIRETHEDFGGRAEVVWTGFPGDMADTNGHGTHCSGTIAGAKYGVAKKAQLVGVKVFQGARAKTSIIVAGISFAIDDIIEKGRVGKAVISMSLGGPKSDATNKMIDDASAQGIISVAAAGNSNANADDTSPASAKTALTVGAIDKTWTIWGSSNWGKSLDLFAPGADVTSAGIASDSASQTYSGTSMAAPHVAGLVLTAISVDGIQGTDAITKHLLKNATPNAVKGNLKDSVNLLANNGNTQQ